MSNWDTELSVHKAKVKGQIEVRPASGGKNRKPRKWKVMCPPWPNLGIDWWVAYRGADRAACEAWIEKKRRSYYVTRQNQSPEAHADAATQTARSADCYRIDPPKTTDGRDA